MTREEALQILAQIANDFLQTLPPSAKTALGKAAQEAINKLQEKEATP